MLACQAHRERRNSDLELALRSPDSFNELILQDSARLIASVGGYAAPLELKDLDHWIENMMSNDPVFVAKAKATASLIQEYAHAMRWAHPGEAR